MRVMKTRIHNQGSRKTQTVLSNGQRLRGWAGATFSYALVAILLVAQSGCVGVTGAPKTGNTTGPTPTSSLSSTSLTFGNVAIGSNTTQTLTVTNSGTATLTVSQLSVSGTGFSLVGNTSGISISPSQAQTFQIKFAPQTMGNVTGNLTVTSNDPTSPQTIAMAGVGMEPQITLTPSPLNFGSVAVGGSVAQTVTLANTGNAPLSVTAATASGAGFSLKSISLPASLNPGQNLSFSVQFAPTSAGNASGSVVFTNNMPANSPALALSGTAVASNAVLTANPTTVSFGTVLVGSQGTQNIVLSNTGTANLTISTVTASGTGFSVSGSTLPITLAQNQTTTLTATFAPTTTGNPTGTITVTSNASNPTVTINLTGTASHPQPQLSINPSSVNFGSVAAGSNATQNITLSNTGTSPMSITQITASGTGFSVTNSALPISVPAGQNTSIAAKFAPTAAGSASGSISVTSNAPGSPATIALSGTGTQGQLSSNPSSVNFGNVLVGSSGSQTVTLTNTGTSSLSISQATASGAGFGLSGLALPLTLNANQSATFSAQFAPASAGGASGSITLTDTGSNPTLTISLSGAGTQPGISATPSSLNLGSVTTGSSNTQTVTLKNTGTASLTISQATVTGSGFSINGLSFPLTIAAGNTATLNVVFTPTAAGSASGSISLTSNAPNSPMTVTLSGTGVAPTLTLNASPSSLDFGSVNVSSNNVLGVTLTNAGNANVTISGVSVTGAGFSASGVSSGLTLAPSQTAILNVMFAPSAAGSASGNVTVTSNATNSPASVTLSGTGVQTVSHSVSLSWTASTSSVSGYNVYRASVSGGPYVKINSTLVNATLFTDSSVVAGQLYFYVVTAVDSSNLESAYSSEASAAVPTP